MAKRMFLETVRADGLAHLSYVVGHGGVAAVVDPRRDIEVYLELAERQGARIDHVFETHRNEDYVVGSLDLADRTGAEIHHGEGLEFTYGSSVEEGDRFPLGDLEIEVLETPGHTFESISLVLRDRAVGDTPLAVFTGDALFVGDVGRTDFFPDRAEEVAGLLFDSIHGKLLPLGDQTILLPAHGAGSVCGGGMAPRDFSTLGHERAHNPRLALDREAFVAKKTAERHDQPPYFRRMEEWNRKGPPRMPVPPRPPFVSPGEIEEWAGDGARILDVRSPLAFAAGHVPGSLHIGVGLLGAWAGWLLSYDEPLLLVADGPEQGAAAVLELMRLGFDDHAGCLAGVESWINTGRDFGRIPTVPATELRRRVEEGVEFTLLDVRKDEEHEAGHPPGAWHVHLGRLPEAIGSLPPERPLTTFCGGGPRAMIAASLLLAEGVSGVEVCYGAMAAWRGIGGEIREGRHA